MSVIPDQALDQLFRNARSHNGWLDKPVTETELRAIYDLTKMGPTSVNIQPQRIVFVTTPAAKERLKPHLSAGNRDKTMAAPVTAILAYDTEYFVHIPKVFPHNPGARAWFEGQPHQESTAFRNATLQGAYFILAARAIGLDTGPMSGFDNAGVDKEFFAGTTFKSNFIVSLGHGDHSKVFARSPRFEFNEVCQVL